MDKYELIVLPEYWSDKIANEPADRGGGQLAIVTLNSDEEYKCIIENSTYIFYVEDYEYVPFSESEIKDIKIIEIYLDAYNHEAAVKRGKYLYGKGIIRDPMPDHSIKRDN